MARHDPAAELAYSTFHTWLERRQRQARVGVTEHAQRELGDVVYVQLPRVGRSYAGGECCAVIESVKTASDVHCPVAGTVLAVNPELQDNPGLVNEDPYGRGWLFRLQPQAAAEVEGLLSAAAYRERVRGDTDQ